MKNWFNKYVWLMWCTSHSLSYSCCNCETPEALKADVFEFQNGSDWGDDKYEIQTAFLKSVLREQPLFCITYFWRRKPQDWSLHLKSRHIVWKWHISTDSLNGHLRTVKFSNVFILMVLRWCLTSFINYIPNFALIGHYRIQ